MAENSIHVQEESREEPSQRMSLFAVLITTAD
jgi:hypothetical protein